MVSLGSDAKVVLPFILTHPKPEPQVSRHSELKTQPCGLENAQPLTNNHAEVTQQVSETSNPNVEIQSENTPEVSNPPTYNEVNMKSQDINLITFDEVEGNDDLVFEDFVRLRVEGETDA